jgi:hypothetical protein
MKLISASNRYSFLSIQGLNSLLSLLHPVLETLILGLVEDVAAALITHREGSATNWFMGNSRSFPYLLDTIQKPSSSDT